MGNSSTLFLIASIRSHLQPAFYLADLLNEKRKIYFGITENDLAHLIEKNGYQAIKQSSIRFFQRNEAVYLSEHLKKKVNWRNMMKVLLKNEVYKHREEELLTTIKNINADTVIIDVYNYTDYLVLKNTPNLKIFFFNPMPSIYKVKDFPQVMEGHWMKGNYQTLDQPTEKHSVWYFISNFLTTSLNFVYKIQEDKILHKKEIKKQEYTCYPNLTTLFKEVPELILAPLELELSPEVRQSWQYYLGLCTRPNRTDLHVDPLFEPQWEKILHLSNIHKIIYVSFGTFYNGSDRPLFDFIEKILQAAAGIEGVSLIVSVNTYVIQSIIDRYGPSENVYFFTKVPQLKVLEHTDVFITHGGLGSIKEAIEFKVPMLLYPLDLRYDQNGNGLKVEYHQIGLRGNMNNDDVPQIQEKLVELLTNPIYKEKITKMKIELQTKYTPPYLQGMLKGLGL